MAIDTPPPAPSSANPGPFTTMMDTFLAYFATLVTQLNAFLVSLGIIAAGGGTSTSYVWDSGTSDADPGANKIRINNATQNLGTVISVNLADANGVDMTNFFSLLSSSTSTTSKAQIKLTKLADPTKWMEFKATAYAATTYGDITGTVFKSSVASPFTAGDVVTVNVSLTGDKGDNGALGLGAATPASGNVTLTNASTALQRIAATAYGQFLTLPDATTMPTVGTPIYCFKNTGEYPMGIKDKSGTILGWAYPTESSGVSLHDKSTLAGQWDAEDLHLLALQAQYGITALSPGTNVKLQAVTMDSDRVLLLFGDTTVYGIVYTRSTASFGTPVSIRATINAGIFYGVAVPGAANNVLVVSEAGTPTTTSLQGVVVSCAGNVITVNTAANPTLAAAATKWSPGVVAVNGSFAYGVVRNTSGAAVLGISVTGTTVAWGAESQLGAAASGALAPHLYVSGTTLMALLGTDNTNFTAKPFTINGSTLTGGTAATVAQNGNNTFKSAAWGSKWLVLAGSSGSPLAIDVSLSGTVASLTSVSCGLANGSSGFDAGIVSATKAVVMVLDSAANTNAQIQVLTDNGSGTISAGTPVVVAGSTAAPVFVTASGTTARLVSGTDGIAYSVDCSGVSPVVTQQKFLASTTQIAAFARADDYMLLRNYTNLQAGSLCIGLPTAGTQLTQLAVTANAHRFLAADVIPCGTVGCVGTDGSESWVAVSTFTNGFYLQCIRAATP